MSATHVNNTEKEKSCKYCKKSVKTSLDCRKCGSSFHRSCALQAKVVDKDEKVICCKLSVKSEIKSLESLPENSTSPVFANMDQKTLTSIIKSTLNDLLGPFKKDIEKKLSELKNSVQFMSDAFEDQKRLYEQSLEEIKILRNENNTLKAKVTVLESKFDMLEQKEKANNIIISGVPKQTETNTGVISKQIFTSMGVHIGENDIYESFRVNKQDDSMILVKLRKSEKKHEIMKKIKELKGITVLKCGLQGIDKKIFLNDDMTVVKRQLFKKARELKRERGYKAVYTLNGNIYVKKKDGVDAIKIVSEESLQAL